MTDTLVFQFFASFWEDTTGKIFLVTFLAYSSSYMLYSGYISWFAGGYGGLLLSQFGFTAIDFLSLFPTSVLLLAETFRKMAIPFMLFIGTYITGPVIVAVILYFVTYDAGTHHSENGQILGTIGIGLWLSALLLAVFPGGRPKKTAVALAILLAYGGMALTFLYIPTEYTPPSPSNPPILEGNNQQIRDLGYELAAGAVVFLVSLMPFTIGLSMAKSAVDQKLLSRLTRMVLNQSIQIPGLYRVEPASTPVDSNPWQKMIDLIHPPKPVAETNFTYISDPAYPVYLVASFSRIMVLYTPPELLQDDKGTMVVLTNDNIISFEVERERDPSQKVVA